MCVYVCACRVKQRDTYTHIMCVCVFKNKREGRKIAGAVLA